MFVIESAATKRSFRRFLGTPAGHTPSFKQRLSDWGGASEELGKSHPEQRPPARHPPPPPGSPGACGSGWSQPMWSGWAWAWSSRRCGWARNGGILQTATATQTSPEVSESHTSPLNPSSLMRSSSSLGGTLKSKISVLKETRRPKYKEASRKSWTGCLCSPP